MKARITHTECPIARTLQSLGAWWSLLILRDAFQGATRFDHFQKSLGIAPNILSQRLSQLTDAGLFERRLYSERPPRYEYVLTTQGRDFFPIVVAVFAWGNKHLFPEGQAVQLANARSKRPVDPVLIDAASRKPILPTEVVLVPGPNARPRMRKHLAALKPLANAD
jgi:DNA-binding HxlR family transcriptional regulator